MSEVKKTVLTFVSAFVLLLAWSSAYIVDETQQVIITQFGKPVGEPIVTPGLRFKLPFIQEAHYFDKRFLEWDGDPNEMTTKEKRYIWVDTYARWRISDPLLYFQRLQDERRAQSRLDGILDGETRKAIANHSLVEIVRSTNRQPVVMGPADEQTTFLEIAIGREKITRDIIEAARPRTVELGIELLDLRFKRINYREDVERSIYERMITERKRIADRFRAEGQGEALKILGDKDRDLKKIQSEAYRTAQEIIGKADAEATAIYASAYNQSQAARDFYSFLKTMETLESTLSEKDMLILSTSNDFYKYLQKAGGR